MSVLRADDLRLLRVIEIAAAGGCLVASLELLRDLSGMSPRRIRTARDHLESAGALSVNRGTFVAGSQRKASSYSLTDAGHALLTQRMPVSPPVSIDTENDTERHGDRHGGGVGGGTLSSSVLSPERQKLVPDPFVLVPLSEWISVSECRVGATRRSTPRTTNEERERRNEPSLDGADDERSRGASLQRRHDDDEVGPRPSRALTLGPSPRIWSPGDSEEARRVHELARALLTASPLPPDPDRPGETLDARVRRTLRQVDPTRRPLARVREAVLHVAWKRARGRRVETDGGDYLDVLTARVAGLEYRLEDGAESGTPVFLDRLVAENVWHSLPEWAVLREWVAHGIQERRAARATPRKLADCLDVDDAPERGGGVQTLGASLRAAFIQRRTRP